MAESMPVNTIKRVRTPTVIQMEAMECGAASLAMILEYYGLTVPLEELRVACGVSRDGVKASNIVRAARKLGLEAKGYRREPFLLHDLQAPMIVHWNFNHFLVLEGMKGNKVYLNDPASGRRKVTREEFDEAFTGVVLAFKPGEGFKPGGVKHSTFASLRSRFQDVRALLFVVLAGIFLVLPGLATPIFSKVFVDNILIAELDGWLRPLLLGMVIAALLKGFLTWLQQVCLLRYRTKIAVSESSKYIGWLLQMPMVFFSQRMAGDLGKRVRNNDRVAQLLTGKLATSLLSMFTVVFYLALMLFFDVTLTIIGFSITSINLILLKWVARAREDQNLNLMMEMGKVYGTGASGILMVESLKASGAESDFFSKWAGYHAKLVNSSQKLGRLNYVVNVAPPILGQLNTTVILALGALKVMNGDMSVGMLVAFQSLMASFVLPFHNLVSLAGELQEARGTMAQLDDVYGQKRDPSFENRFWAESKTPSKLSGGLEIRNVSFGYSQLEPPLIQDFSLKMRPGSRIALVGRSGSGKSTVARLIAGLYEPWSGEILFDGKRRMDYPRETIVNSVVMVDQQITLFEGTIRDNLTMWDYTIPESHLIEAAEDAQIHHDISSRPGAYGGKVAESGKNFSGGQRQRLEIARGLALNPSILILDEATSALDAQTENAIDSRLRRRRCTCLIVAHRLSTIRDCDEIIVMDRGKIAQRGTHEALLAEPGVYAQLIKTM